MDKEYVKKALEVGYVAVYGCAHGVGVPNNNIARAIEALDAAGLLATPLMLRAVELAKEYARSLRLGYNFYDNLSALGREAIEAETPKERWTARGCSVYCSGVYYFHAGTEAHAKAAAAALNAVDREREGK